MEADSTENVKNEAVRNISEENISLDVDTLGVPGHVSSPDHHGSAKVKDDRLWESIKRWAEFTTFHGIRNIFDEKTSIYRRGFWLLITCVFLILTVLLCQDQLNRYFDYKTLTEEVSQFPRTIPFPAVTICSCNQIKNDSITDERERMLLQELYYSKQPNSTFLNEELGTTFLQNISLRQLFENSAFSEEELFRECFWEGVDIDCTLAWQQIRTNAGHCFTFNSESRAKSYGSKVVRMTGKNFGLHLMLWTNTENYFVHEDSCLGFKLMIHEPWEKPDVDKVISIGSGSTHHVAISRHEYTYLPFPVLAFGDQECFDKNATPVPAEYQYYTVHFCIDQCRVQYIYNQCGCVGPLDEGNFPECNPIRLIECYRYADVEFPSHVEDCYCPVPCAVIEFQSEATSAQFSTQFIRNQHVREGPLKDMGEENISANLVEVKIFYANKVIKRHDQVLAVTFEDLWAAFGGFLGISVGASIVTFLEMLEVLVVNGVHHFRFMRNLSRDSRPEIR